MEEQESNAMTHGEGHGEQPSLPCDDRTDDDPFGFGDAYPASEYPSNKRIFLSLLVSRDVESGGPPLQMVNSLTNSAAATSVYGTTPPDDGFTSDMVD